MEELNIFSLLLFSLSGVMIVMVWLVLLNKVKWLSYPIQGFLILLGKLKILKGLSVRRTASKTLDEVPDLDGGEWNFKDNE